ncbi:hypothetical protein D3C72_2489550 [compost metagenome]
MRAIKIAGIDMVDPAGDHFTQNRDGRFRILRRTENPRPGELHGAIAEPLDGMRAERKGT